MIASNVVAAEITTDEMARARVSATLNAIEAAQAEIDRAAQALAAVRGFVPQYERLLEIYETVRAAWYAVEERSRVLGGGIKLDHDEVTAYELAEWGRDARP
jgi:hypothetical protein